MTNIDLQERLDSPILFRWEIAGGILGGVLSGVAFIAPDALPPSLSGIVFIFVIMPFLIPLVAGLGWVLLLFTVIPWLFSKNPVRRRQAKGALRGCLIAVAIALPIALLTNGRLFFKSNGIGSPSFLWFVILGGAIGAGGLLAALAPLFSFRDTST